MKNVIYLCIACILLSSCATSGGYNAQKSIYEIATDDFKVQKFYTSTFVLYGLLRSATGQNDNLHVYIEGDGFAWVSRSRVSKNPTPTDNVTRSLAEYDPSNAAVLYLARPCQYVKEDDFRMCNYRFWTSHRLAPEVIVALNEAVSQAKSLTNAKNISLIGYSGGGGAAALVAAKRNDVKFLGSVAGLLDHVTWTNMHEVSPLIGSLNPVDSAHLLSKIPQRHVTGSTDDVVPASSQISFCNNIEQSNACITIDGVGHYDQWSRIWDYNIY